MAVSSRWTLDFAEGIGTFAEVETIAETDSDLLRHRRYSTSPTSLGLTEIESRWYRGMLLEQRSRDAGNAWRVLTAPATKFVDDRRPGRLSFTFDLFANMPASIRRACFVG